MTTPLPFNKPFISGNEMHYVARSIANGAIQSDGEFAQNCSNLLESRFNIRRVLLTPSCTAALEIAAILSDLKHGDEVIMSSYTYVSSANAFMRTGAKPVFVDIRPDTMNIDVDLIEAAITDRTRAIVPVHYAGVSCDMDRIMALAEKHDLIVVEDAAQGVNCFYQQQALGSIGHLGCYSFHDTKNFVCGEGGALCINDERFLERAEILRDKGTNRQEFLRGETDKYTWVDVGSSYIPSEIAIAFLYGQLESIDLITARRREIFERYQHELRALEDTQLIRLPRIPKNCLCNYHMFYVLLPNSQLRDTMLAHLRSEGIQAAFHYVPLHESPIGQTLGYQTGDLPVTEDQSARMARLPLFCELSRESQARVVRVMKQFLEHAAGSPAVIDPRSESLVAH